MEEDVAKELSIIAEFKAIEIVELAGLQSEGVFVAGRFELLEVLGEGSYGTVFLAQDHELPRKVAVKLMPIGDPDETDEADETQREGSALAALKHPNVVRIHDQGSKDDYRWLVLEFLEGPTLREWCRGRPAREVLARYLEAGDGLNAAHRRGLVHRDFKPSNVRLDHDGHAVAVDFGLARKLESLREEDEGTRVPAGTIAYMPPERMLNQVGDERSDQFAFCVALWEALAREHPFAHGGMEPAAQFIARFCEPKGERQIPRRLRPALKRGMAETPGERWPTMTMLLAELRRRETPRVWWWLGIAGMAGALGLGAWSQVPTPPGLDVILDFELPVVDEMSREALRGIDQRDHDVIVQALSAGYPAALREGRAREFVKVAEHAAVHLEAANNTFDAQFAWSMVARLSHEVGDEEHSDAAKAKSRALNE